MPLAFDRRWFLRSTAGLGTATAVVTLGGSCSRSVPPRPAGVRVMTREQADTMGHVIDVLLPGDETFPSGRSLNLLPRVDAALARYPEPIRARMLDAILFLEWSPMFSWGLKSFSQRQPEERSRIFADFARSAWAVKRAIHVGLRALVLFAYADDPRIWPLIGYDGPWVKAGAVVAQ